MQFNTVEDDFYATLIKFEIPWEAYKDREHQLTITSDHLGKVLMVSLQDEDHKIIKVLWEIKE